MCSLTDKLTGSELVEKTFVYVTNLTHECRKALTTKFEREHKGVSFDSIEPIIRREIESWFAMRDRNVKLSHTNSMILKPGEILITYAGVTKDARFKIGFDCIFTLAGSPTGQLSYLKNLNLQVDKRDFTK